MHKISSLSRQSIALVLLLLLLLFPVFALAALFGESTPCKNDQTGPIENAKHKNLNLKQQLPV